MRDKQGVEKGWEGNFSVAEENHAPLANQIRGNLSDLNQLHGTTSDTKPAGYQGKGTQTLTVTWDLGRQGSSE